MHKQTLNFFVIKVTLVAACAGILFGFDTGVISGAILFIDKEFALTPLLNGWVVSSVLLGALIGSLVAGYLTDRFGRKHVLLLSSLLFLIGTAWCVFAMSIHALVLGRAIVGLAIGVASCATPLYLAELAPESYRGALVSLNQLAVTIGLLLSYMVDYYYTEAESWRMMFAFGFIPAFVLFVGMIFLPYSPRWLLAKGRNKEATLVLNKARGCAQATKLEVQAIQESLKVQHANWREVFKPTVRPTLIIALTLAIIQQVTGINTILYYAPTIFAMTGLSDASGAIFATMGLGLVNFIFTIIALPFIDKLGRRFLLLLGLFGMAIGLAQLMYVFDHGMLSSQDKFLALTGMFIYIASFAVSLGPMMWLMIAELFPLRVRGVGASLAIAGCWSSNMLVASTFLYLVEAFTTRGVFGLYLVFTLCSIFFVYRFVPETKAVTLETIEANLYAGKPWRELGDKL